MPPRADILACPACGNDIGVTLLDTARIDRCPHCHADFIIPSTDGSTDLPLADPFEIIDDTPPDQSPDEVARRLKEERENHLNTLHLASITGQRRSLHRARLFRIGGAIACVIVILQIGFLVFRNPAILEERQRALILAGMVAGCLYFALWLFRSALRIASELRQPLLPPPPDKPDFESLQDGSQHWKNLEQMGEE